MTGSSFRLELSATDGAARTGRLVTAHGPVDTPAFMPVGTAATVKAMFPETVASTGAQMILANTYHLMLRPGAERIAALGGVRRFMNWPGPILTDSGGYQVMSLSKLRHMSEDGVTFQSHIDGSRHHLTPERSIAIQHALDATITMAFDECTPFPAEKAAVAESMRLSMRWAARSRNAYVARPGYGLFGIVQGGIHEDLRAESAAALTAIGFEGYAVGGLAVGEGQELMFATLDVNGAASAGRCAALSDGRGQAVGHRRRSRARHRYVRLRAADALRPHSAGLHQFRPAQYAQRPPRRRSAAARSVGAMRRQPRSTAAPISITW